MLPGILLIQQPHMVECDITGKLVDLLANLSGYLVNAVLRHQQLCLYILLLSSLWIF